MKQQDEMKCTTAIIHMMKQKAQKDYGHTLIKRSAHTQTLAVLKGELSVATTLPKWLRVGVFQEPTTYPVWIRVSSSSNKSKPDSKKDVRGLAIKLMYEGQPQDFILVSTKHMPLRTIKGFHAAVSLLNKRAILKSILTLLQDLNSVQLLKLVRSRKHETSPLDIPYFSLTPYAFGKQAVKYSVIPTSSYVSKKPSPLSETYLRDNMKKHLIQDEATFDMMIQLRRQGMSIEDASQEWHSPMIKVATLRIPAQVFDTPSRKAYGETLTFSPGHALAEHQPLGQLNHVRIRIYEEMQNFRKQGK